MGHALSRMFMNACHNIYYTANSILYYNDHAFMQKIVQDVLEEKAADLQLYTIWQYGG